MDETREGRGEWAEKEKTHKISIMETENMSWCSKQPPPAKAD